MVVVVEDRPITTCPRSAVLCSSDLAAPAGPASAAMARRLAGFPAAPAGEAGLCPQELRRFRAAVRHETEDLGSLAGVSHVVLHRGRCVFACSGGWADRAAGARFGLRTLCRPLMAKVRDRRISDLRALCDAIGRLPLRSKPGSRYDYSFCHDLLGRLCEVISGKRLDIFMRHLLKPLGMKDTHFALPPRKKRPSLNRRRRAAVRARPYALKLYRHKHSAPGILSCGGGILSYLDAGMWGTACDYARFCQMILDGGVAPGGGRVLRPATARALWSDALAPLGRARDGRLPGWHDADGPRPGGWWDYRGLSLLHAYLDHDLPPRGGRPPRRSQSMWFSGGGGAFWTVDAARGLVTVSFAQSLGGREDEATGTAPWPTAWSRTSEPLQAGRWAALLRGLPEGAYLPILVRRPARPGPECARALEAEAAARHALQPSVWPLGKAAVLDPQ
ncbi:unnamed protein product, partial [Prorocentrum cordatum]